MFLGSSRAMNESMEGLFTIIKGQYSKHGREVEVLGEDVYLGGYDPESEDTAEWYRVMDTVTWYTIYCGSSLDAALRSIHDSVMRWKNRREYFKHVCRVTTEDYYEVHYLHHAPLTDEQREKKRQEGKAPRPNIKMKGIDRMAHEEYGWYFEDMVRGAERPAAEKVSRTSPQDSLKRRASSLRRKVSAPLGTMHKGVREEGGMSPTVKKPSSIKVRRVKMCRLA